MRVVFLRVNIKEVLKAMNLKHFMLQLMVFVALISAGKIVTRHLIQSQLLSILFSAKSLKCWTCNSNSPFCDDPFIRSSKNESVYKECEILQYASVKESSVCLKMKLSYENSSKVEIHRKCHHTMSNGCKQTSHARIEFCETCAEDGCNGELHLKPWFVMIMFSVLSTYL